jgi:hypothetical protein
MWSAAEAAAREVWRMEKDGILAPPVGEDITRPPPPPPPPERGSPAWYDSLRVTKSDDGWIIENDDCGDVFPTREAASETLERMRSASAAR